MSTRCRIAYYDDGCYKSVYCHHDGYVEGVGATLVKHYPTLDDAKKLISLGDFSSLWDTFEQTAYTAYSNRGEANIEATVDYTIIGLIARVYNSWGEYLYLFKEGKWKVFDIYGFSEFCEETQFDFVEDKLKEDE